MAGFFTELKRRNVVRVAIAYVVVAWILIEAASVLFPGFHAPDWVFQVFTTLVILGFPLALIFAWAFELTTDGIRRTAELPAGYAEARSHRKMDLIIIGLLAVALVISVGLNILQRESGGPRVVTGGGDKSIAVLPFVNRSAKEDDAFFVDGMHDELLTQLTKIGSLKVISRTSVMEYRDTDKKIPQIASELGVAAVLEGGVQRAGDRVRIHAQLIHANSDEHLWAESYDRELTVGNLLEVQSEIARAIAAALQAALSPEESTRLDRQLTDDLPAYDAYLRAKLTDRTIGYDAGARDYARSNLEFALERDPDFAAAWALYARSLLAYYWFVDPDPALLEKARAAIDRGRSIAPDLHELDIAEGYYHYWGFRDYARARVSIERALEVAPGDSDLWALLGFISRREGDFEASLAAMRRVLALDPLAGEANLTMAEIYNIVYDWDSAQRMIDAAQTLGSAPVYLHDLQALVYLERDSKLQPAFELIERWGAFDVMYAGLPWWIEVVRGNYEESLAHADFGEFSETKFGLQPPGLQRGLTHLYAGDAEAARRELEPLRVKFEAQREERPADGRVHRALCIVYGALQLQEQTREACRQGLEHAAWDAFETGFVRVEVARGLALAGLTNEALDLIEFYLAEPSGFGAVRTELEPAFRSLHDQPRFRELVEQFRGRKLQELSFE